MTALLGLWLWRARAPLIGLGLGAIIGGALGNGYDRLAYGAVADFLDLHAFGRHFFVFNLADAAINVGVALLIFDGLFGSGRPSAPGSKPRAAVLTGRRSLFSDFHAREHEVRRAHRPRGGPRDVRFAIELPNCRVNEWTGFVVLPRFGASRDEG